jgi:hypothetical protein
MRHDTNGTAHVGVREVVRTRHERDEHQRDEKHGGEGAPD